MHDDRYAKVFLDFNESGAAFCLGSVLFSPYAFLPFLIYVLPLQEAEHKASKFSLKN